MPVPGLVPGISAGTQVYAAELAARRGWPAFAGHGTDESDPMLADIRRSDKQVRARRSFTAFERGYGLLVTGVFCSLLLGFLAPAAALAEGQYNPTGNTVAGESVLPLSPQGGPDQSATTPQWTVSLGGIALGRLGGVNRTLDARVPGSVPFLVTAITPGTEIFNSDQFQQGLSAGPKVGLTYHNNAGYGVELSYFNIFNQNASVSIGPDSPADWLIMRAPGGFWQTQDFPYQAMTWNATTNLYSAELDGRLDVSRRVTLLAGFRWVQLNDGLEGALTPTDRTAPTWKTTCPLCNLFQVTPDGPIGILPPFWKTGTTNNLFGAQAGVAGKILEFWRVSLDGRITAGLFDNSAEQSTGVSIQKVVYPTTASANGLAFVSEASLQVKYRIMNGLVAEVGYEMLWLNGIALAPRQIDMTDAAASWVHAFGIAHGSDILFQGITFGLEYQF